MAWETCTCPDGSTYQSTNCSVTDPCMCHDDCENDDTGERVTNINRGPVRGRAVISKTRGVPSRGSLEYGPRGQRQAFRGFTGTNWQQDTPAGTGWQQKGVFSNWRGPSMEIDTDTIPMTVTKTTTTTTEPEKMGFSPVNVALSMLSVGVLFFVIGYSYEKGKTS